MIHRVCAGALLGPSGVLLAHRSPHRPYYPECWDFPGGHVEPGESASAALRRELREEIGVEVEVSGVPRLHIEEPAADGGLDLRLWVLTTWAGEPRNLAPEEHDDLRWVVREELPTLRLAHPSYIALLEELLAPTDDPAPPRAPAAHSTPSTPSLDH